jgi:hypothetical protein
MVRDAQIDVDVRGACHCLIVISKCMMLLAAFGMSVYAAVEVGDVSTVTSTATCGWSRPCASKNEYCYESVSSGAHVCSERKGNFGLPDFILIHPWRPNVVTQYVTPALPSAYIDVSSSISYVVGEYDVQHIAQRRFKNGASLHEITLDGSGGVWLVQQLSDTIVRVTVDSASAPDSVVNVTSWTELGRNGIPTNGSMGAHKLIFSRFHRGVAFIALEFANQIGVFNLTTHAIDVFHDVPLQCLDDTCDSSPGHEWVCFSCDNEWTDPGIGKKISSPQHTSIGCPHGAHPHMLTEDAVGNLWVSLKSGGIARLTKPATTGGRWFVHPIPVGSLSFYIASGGGHVWLNAINGNAIYHVADPDDALPRVTRIELGETSVTSYVRSESSCETLPSITEQGVRPGAFYVLENGDCVIAAYQRGGIIIRISSATNTVQRVRLVSTVPLQVASLHLDARKRGNSSVHDVVLMASAQDFQSGIGSMQSDILMTTSFDESEPFPSEMTIARHFGGSVQNQWFHRVAILPEGVIVATCLLTDRLLVSFPVGGLLGQETTETAWNGRRPPYGSAADWHGR